MAVCKKCLGNGCEFCTPISELKQKPIIQVKETEFGYNTIEVIKQHSRMLRLHYNTIGCHCECLGMASENILSEVTNQEPIFNYKSFAEVMGKWGLVNDKGEPIL